MQLIKVLIGSLIATPAMAHHEGSTTVGLIDVTFVALLCATVFFFIAAAKKTGKPAPAKETVLKIKSSENKQ